MSEQQQPPPSNESGASAPQVTNAPAQPPQQAQGTDQQAIFRNLLDREKQVRQAAAQVSEQRKKYESLEALMSSSGKSLDDIQALLAGGGAPPARQATDLESRLEELQKQVQSFTEREKQAQEQAELNRQYETERARVEQALKQDNKYPYIEKTGAYGVVLDEMLAEYQRTGQYPSEAAIASKVNEGLQKLAEMLSGVRNGARQPEAVTIDDLPQTLTNRAAAQVTTRGNDTPTSFELLDSEDIVNQAASLLRFKKQD